MRIEVARLCTGLSVKRPDLKARGPSALVGPWDPGWVQAAGPYLRTPSRVYRNVAESSARRLEALFEDLRSALREGRSHLEPYTRTPFTVEVVDGRSVQAGPLQIRGTVKNAVLDVMGGRVDPKHPRVRWAVRRRDDDLVLSIDLLGPLSHRGYRRPGAEAPLRENLAAQMVALSGWRPDSEVLVDPMCGTGTILIEAWGWAVGAPARRVPGGRSDLPALFGEVEPELVGVESDPRIFNELKATLQHARVEDVRVRRAEADAFQASQATGRFLSNPPYGERLDEAGAFEALARLKDRHPGWILGVLGPPDLVIRALGDAPKLDKPMPNGPLQTHFVQYEPRT